MTAAIHRTAPRAVGHRRAMPRDLDVLAFSHRALVVEAAHVATLLGVSIPVARRLLRRLRDLRLLTVSVAALHEPNRYTIAPRARMLLADLLACEPNELTIPRGYPRYLEHHLGTVEVIVAMLAGSRFVRGLRVLRYAFEHELRAMVANAADVLVPDGVVVYEHGHDNGRRTEFALAIEFDRGTESPRFFSTSKRYDLLRAQGLPLLGCADWSVCCVTPTERRRNRLVSALWGAGVPEGLWYFCAPGLTPTSILRREGWVTPRAVDTDRAELVHECPLPLPDEPPGGGTTRWSDGGATPPADTAWKSAPMATRARAKEAGA